MDKETYIQIDRMEQKLDYLIELLTTEEETEEQEEEKPKKKGEMTEQQMIDRGILIKKSIKNKTSELTDN